MFLDDELAYNRLALERRLSAHIDGILELQYQPPTKITEVCQGFANELQYYARAYSPVYFNHRGIIKKEQLLDRDSWYVGGYSTQNGSTGGSTTGGRFNYLRWATHFRTIECDLHYLAILREFGLDRPVNVLYFMLDLTSDRNRDNLIKTYTTQDTMVSHGKYGAALVHEVIRSKLYYNDYRGFYEAIFDYCDRTDIDVILCPGQVVKALAWNAARLKRTKPICKLISNTGDKVDRSVLEKLRTSGLIGDWCDHMRCWDGGVTFMTCKHHTSHLLDGLAWAWTTENQELISTDFYSLPSPFVNYWNGDYGTIAGEYKLCPCGRYYREFSLDRTRDYQYEVSGTGSEMVRKQLAASGVDLQGIIRVTLSCNFIRLFTSRTYSTEERKKIRAAIPLVAINFVTEEPYG